MTSLDIEGKLSTRKRARNPRVIMITPLFPPEYAGGSRQAFELCKALMNLGAKVTILAGSSASLLPFQRVKSERISGFKVFRVYRRPNSGTIDLIIYALGFLVSLIRLRNQYDIIHVHGIRYYVFLALPVAKAFRKKLLAKMTLMGSDDPGSILRRHFGPIQLRIVCLLDRLVAPSNAFYHLFSAIPFESIAKKVLVIPNGVDIVKYAPTSYERKIYMRRELGLPEHAKLCIFTGVVDYRKGIDVLIQSWNQVISENSDAQLLVVGPRTKIEFIGINSRFVSDLEDKIQLMGFHGTVRFLGYKSTVIPYLKAADLFVLPSRREGLPNSLLEAMSCGLPVIATGKGWGKEIIENNVDGVLLDTLDSKELEQKICFLLDNHSKRNELGMMAREKITKGYSIQRVAQLYLMLYSSLMIQQ